MWLLLLALGGLSGCSKADPYNPPDLFYYFASYKVGKNPTSITTADLNSDSLTDLVTTNISSNTLSILQGNGKFEEGPHYPVHRTPVGLAADDLNGDGHSDLVVTLRNDKIKIFLGSGTG